MGVHLNLKSGNADLESILNVRKEVLDVQKEGLDKVYKEAKATDYFRSVSRSTTRQRFFQLSHETH